MKLKMKSLLAFAAIAVASAHAGNYIHVTGSAGHSFSDTVSVPAGTTARQFGAVYYVAPDFGNYMINNGPLGNYTQYVGQYLDVSGAVSAGNHNIYQYVSYNGYSGTQFSW